MTYLTGTDGVSDRGALVPSLGSISCRVGTRGRSRLGLRGRVPAPPLQRRAGLPGARALVRCGYRRGGPAPAVVGRLRPRPGPPCPPRPPGPGADPLVPLLVRGAAGTGVGPAEDQWTGRTVHSYCHRAERCGGQGGTSGAGARLAGAGDGRPRTALLLQYPRPRGLRTSPRSAGPRTGHPAERGWPATGHDRRRPGGGGAVAASRRARRLSASSGRGSRRRRCGGRGTQLRRSRSDEVVFSMSPPPPRTAPALAPCPLVLPGGLPHQRACVWAWFGCRRGDAVG